MTGLYVHIPFCSIKCYYCDFAAFAGKSRMVDRYLGAVESELTTFRRPRGGISTLYVGGGTPSELTAPQLDRLLRTVERLFGPLTAMKEATVEANPESLDDEKLRTLVERGVGRLSIGLQTTQDALLEAIGRKHTYAQFKDRWKAARKAGFENLNVDLMFGLPGQTLKDFEESLEDVIKLKPDHVSAYGLQVEDRTHFKKWGVEPDEETMRRMFEALIDGLKAAGFVHYEISNFARPGREAVHNTLYWTGVDYFGAGCSASSFFEGRRWTNLERLDAYLKAVEADKPPIEETEQLEGKARLGEQAMLGLRLIDGWEPPEETWKAFADEWKALEREKLIEKSGEKVKLTREGIFVANRVFERFVGPFK